MDAQKELKLFRKNLELILKTSKEALKITRETPMSNLKLVERSSKCLKDPNPLGSTMAIISTKYPITLEWKKAKEYNVPREMLAPRPTRDDMHFHGRVLCKKETIDWWIERNEVVSEENRKIVDFLYSCSDQLVQDYKSINWDQTRISWGQPNLERRFIPTHTPVMHIDKSQRVGAISRVLMPEYLLPSNVIQPSYIQAIKDIISKPELQKVALSGQIRCILQQLDPKVRMLPVMPQSKDSDGPLKHALMHNNLLMVGVTSKRGFKSTDYTNILDNLGRVCVSYYKTSRWIDKDLHAVEHILVNDVKIRHFISTNDIQETIYIKWLKVCLRLPIKAEHIMGDFVTSPAPTRVRLKKMYNKANVSYFTYLGSELINFKYKGMRGNFTHDGPTFLGLVTNFTNLKELKSLICEIGVYIRWGMEDSLDTNITRMKDTTRNKLIVNPHHLFSMTKQEFLSIKSKHTGFSLKGVTFLENTEYTSYASDSPYIANTGNIHCRGSRKIEYPKNIKYVPISQEIFVPNSSLNDILDFKRMVKRLTSYYLMHTKTLLECIQTNNWAWKNPNMNYYTKGCKLISNTCREFIKDTLSAQDKYIMSFLYIFCREDPTHEPRRETNFMIMENELDFSFNKGMLTYDETNNQYSLFNTPLGYSSHPDTAKAFQFLLGGYTLSCEVDEDLEVRSPFALSRDYYNIEHGSSYKTFIRGHPFKATRDANLNYQINQTINRQIQSKREWESLINERIAHSNFAKRAAPDDLTPNPKKLRTEPSTSTCEHEDIDEDDEDVLTLDICEGDDDYDTVMFEAD